MGSEMLDLESKTTSDDKNIIVQHKSGIGIPFYQGKEQALDSSSYTSYIYNIERQIRTSKEYKAYIRYLKEDLDPPLNHCMIYSNITDDKAPIEMHHGPIFTLFDYVEIMINYFMRKGEFFSTSRIQYEVMKEHRANHVQIVMLSEMAHNAIHPPGRNKKNAAKPKFLDFRMAYGDLVSFLELYYTGLGFNHVGKIKRYFDIWNVETKEKNPQKGFFNEVITKWSDYVDYPILGLVESDEETGKGDK